MEAVGAGTGRRREGLCNFNTTMEAVGAGTGWIREMAL